MKRLKYAALALALTWLASSLGQVAGEPKLAAERVILHTNLGDITLGLYAELAPRHVAQILRLVDLGVYEDSDFFRIEKGFVAQVENFNMRRVPLPPEKQNEVHKLDAEFNSVAHVRGIVSMARLDDINSAESSFSLVLGEAPHLNGKYSVFGRVTNGMDVLARIENTPVDEHSRPKSEVKIVHAEVLRAGSPYAAPPAIPWPPYAAVLLGLLAGAGAVFVLLKSPGRPGKG